jgi:peptidoglycan/xylan/chitin deacetylase (PgdA/CDA1 family)
MRLPRNIRDSQTLRRWRSFIRPGVAVLGYHRVHAGAADPLGLSVAPARFAEHLQVIVRMLRPVRLRDAAESLRTGRVPRRAVVVTFDDGYADNLHAALPLLEQYGVPATMFVTSGNRGGEFWWDRLARLRLREPGPGHDALSARLQHLDEAARDALLRELERQAPLSAPLHRTLTAAELQQLAASSLIEIGAHTVTHAPLSSLAADRQRDELERSRAELEALLDRPVTSFAYPHGALTPTTTALVGAAGYENACCSKQDVATPRAPALALPRLWVGDWDGARFEHWLRGWLHVR